MDGQDSGQSLRNKWASTVRSLQIHYQLCIRHIQLSSFCSDVNCQKAPVSPVASTTTSTDKLISINFQPILQQENMSLFPRHEWSLQSKQYFINSMGIMKLSLDIIKTKNILYCSFVRPYGFPIFSLYWIVLGFGIWKLSGTICYRFPIMSM